MSEVMHTFIKTCFMKDAQTQQELFLGKRQEHMLPQLIHERL